MCGSESILTTQDLSTEYMSLMLGHLNVTKYSFQELDDEFVDFSFQNLPIISFSQFMWSEYMTTSYLKFRLVDRTTI